MEVVKTSSTNCERVHERKSLLSSRFYRFQKSYFSFFTSSPVTHTHTQGQRDLHGGLVCDEMGCCLLERGEVDLGIYRSESQLYGGIDGEALETRRTSTPETRLLIRLACGGSRELSSCLYRLYNHLQLCSRQMLSY